MKKNVCVSVKALYEKFGSRLTYCTILAQDDYYDLETATNGIVCMDGETCNITKVNVDSIELSNNNGVIDTVFVLSKAEFDVAVFETSFVA